MALSDSRRIGGAGVVNRRYHLRIKIDDPTLPHPIWSALIEDDEEGVARLLRRRDRKEEA